MSTNRSDGLETRGRLLDAAGSVFAKKGFHDAKTAEICRLAKANVAAVNYYFGGKEELYVEAWRHAFERSIGTYPPDGRVSSAATPEDRLRGQILALMHRVMDPASLDFDIAYKEMANPTGLLSEVMRRAIEPLHRAFVGVVRELLGAKASEQDVQLCEMSIHAQCFAPLLHERKRKHLSDGKQPPVASISRIGVDAMADHILRFSLAGIRDVRGVRRQRVGRATTGKAES